MNNIAWMLRRFHVFPVPGRGRYRVQPVFVDDVASLAVSLAGGNHGTTTDAAGPEEFTFAGFIKVLGWSMGVHTLVLPTPTKASLAAGAVLSRVLGDVAITDEELGALVAETLVSSGPATAPTKLTDWLKAHASELGRRYTSELARHWESRPKAPSGPTE